MESETTTPVTPANPLAGDSFKDAYNLLYTQITAIVQNHQVNYMNVALIIKAVIETVDGISASQTWDNATYQNTCAGLITYILDDLHNKGKVDDNLFSQLSVAVPIMSYSLVTLIHMANAGEIALQKLEQKVEARCCGTVAAPKPIAATKSRFSVFKTRR